jgi:hypothetical protein
MQIVNADKTLMRLLCAVLFLAGLRSDMTSAAVFCCPGCTPTASETRAETVARSDVVLLVQYVEGNEQEGDKPARTVYEVTLVGKDTTQSFKPKQRLVLDNYREAASGDLFLMNGILNKEETVDWEAPVEITETGYHYVMQAPSPELPRHKRLPYFLKFLEFSDQFIANDAYNEFAFAPFEDVVTLTDQLPREKLRKWITDKETSQTRLGLYGIMLGLCGEPSDAQLLGDLFFGSAEDYVFGMEGIVTGYLFLTRADGLEKIRKQLLGQTTGEIDFLYPLMRAFRIVWTYGGDRVPKQELLEAMRMFLKHDRLDELVIPDLARWQDWESIDVLISKYETETGAKNESLRKQIIVFMMECARQKPAENGHLPATARKAKDFLDRVEAEDPGLLKRVRRFYRLPARSGADKTSADNPSTDSNTGEGP